MFKRPYFDEVRKRLLEPRKFIQVIAGPRQVGKTTLINQVLADLEIQSSYVSADGVDASDTIWITQQWESSRLKMKLSGAEEAVLVFDEIQKISRWSEEVKKQWDRDSREGIKLKIVLLGSSQLLMQEGLTESLTGRFEQIRLGHWSFMEVHEAFGLSPEQYVWFGAYPGSMDLKDDEERWKSYIRDAIVETTILKDVLMMARIDKPALLKQLFELACRYSGQILSFNKMLGQMQDAGNTTTLSYYLQLLSSAGLVTGIQNFSGSEVRTRASSPKLHVMNTALMSALSGRTFMETISDPGTWGRWVESAIGAKLINEALQNHVDVYYWRQRQQEVDFVLKKGEKLTAIEVKSGRLARASGMQAFATQYPNAKVLLVGEEGIPWQDFLKIEIGQLF